MRLIGLFFFSLLLVGCQPKVYDFHVIEIPLEPGVEAIESGEATNDMVFFDETVITAYRLRRDGYTLLARLEFRTSHPSIDFAAHDPAGEALQIVPIRFGVCGGFKTSGLHPEVNGYPGKRYRWMPRWNNKSCASQGRGAYPPEQVFKFEVRTAQGQLLAVEEIPFELKPNGKYLEYDAL